MIEFKDYYKILGVPKSSTTAEIKSAFKKLAKQCHPDTKTGSEEKFKEVNEAYEVLKDKDKRAKYDSMYRYQSTFTTGTQRQKTGKWRKQSPLGDFEDFMQQAASKTPNTKQAKQAQDNGNFSDFFEMLFGHYANQQKAQQQQAASPPPRTQNGEDYEMELELSLEEAYHGSLRKIEITGANKSVRRLEVSIPAHVRDGNKIKIAGEGKPSKDGGKSGDLYLKVKFKKHEDLRVENDDIHSELKLEPHEAVLGCIKTIETINGKVDLTIPAGTKSQKTLRLKSKGLRTAKSTIYGDHLVHTLIEIPENLSEEELELYKKLSEKRSKQ